MQTANLRLSSLNFCFRLLLRLAGQHYGWHPSQYVERVNDPGKDFPTRQWQSHLERVMLTGNPLGFFHCISARKVG